MTPAQDMNKAAVISWLLNQSPAFVVLAVMSFLFWKQSERSQEQNRACNQEIISVYQNQNTQLIQVLQNIEYYIQKQSEQIATPRKK